MTQTSAKESPNPASQADPHVWAVIMAGGSGTRFWPVSRHQQPKQLTRLLGDDTMIQATVSRLQPMIGPERVLVITREELVAATREQLPAVPPEQVIGEPVGRDTAPCVALAAQILAKLDPDAAMLLLPADHVIHNARKLQHTLAAGIAAAREGGLVTFGIVPRSPATGYGYIRRGEPVEAPASATSDAPPIYRVHAFKEKPDAATAQQYLDSGEYFWNSGMFTWTVRSVLDALEQHCPQLHQALNPAVDRFGEDDFAARLGEVYPDLEKISIDYALLEKAQDIKVVEADFDWDDVGSWDSIYQHYEADEAGVVRHGDAWALGCQNSLLFNAGGPFVAAVGVEDLHIVVTPDAVLVCPQGGSQRVKKLVEQMEQQGRTELL